MILVAAATAQELRRFRHPAARSVVTGMGAGAVRSSLRGLLVGGKYDGVISTGFAGALKPDLQSGRIVVDAARSDPGWAARFSAVFPDAATTRFAVADQPVPTPEAKAALHAATAGGAVDMESDAVSALVAEAGTRALFVRVVLDDHATRIGAPVMDWCGQDGKVRAWEAARWALGGRSRIAELALLARLAAGCSKILRRALTVAVDAFPPGGTTPPCCSGNPPLAQ